MAKDSKKRNPKQKGFLQKLWKWSKRIFIWIFIFQLFYIILLKWVNPPVTITQLASWVSGHGLKRDYVGSSEISSYAKLAVIASEDQLFPDHSGFDWKSIKKAMQYNEKKPGRIRGGSSHQPAGSQECLSLAGKKLDKKRTGDVLYIYD